MDISRVSSRSVNRSGDRRNHWANRLGIKILDKMLSFIRWTIQMRMIEGKDALDTILLIRQARERISRETTDH